MASKAKYAIIENFLELIEKYEFDKISVTKLVESCNISRQTFYYHFDDINSMLKTVFDEETEKICKFQEADNWQASAEMYVSFLKKYDTALRKISNSQNFIFSYNLIYNSFYKYISSYYEIKKGKNPLLNDDSEFIITYSACAIAGLVVLELEKEKSDYKEILSKLSDGFTAIKK